MPRVFSRGSRRQPAALVSDQPIPASTGIWCRQAMACSGKPCRQSANLTPVPCSSTSKRSPLAATHSVYISGIQHIDLIRQYRGAGIDLLINGDRNDGETRDFSPRMSCPTWPDGRCRKTAGGGDHVDRRCAWGAKRNRAYLPRLPVLTRRALPDFAEPYLSRIRIAGNKAASRARAARPLSNGRSP